MKTERNVLLASVGILLLLGLVMLYSASVTQASSDRVLSHALWILAGTLVATILAFVDYRLLQRPPVSRILLGLLLLGLAAVLIPGIGEKTNGARRWFVWGGQPSEFAKITLLIVLADYAARHAHLMSRFREGFLVPGGLVAIVGGLIFLEPDWGTAVLVGATGGVVLLVAGTRLLYLAPSAFAALGLLVLLVQRDPHRLGRLLSFTDPERWKDGIGWQGWHSVLSLGVGGWWGTFLGGGSHKFGFVPEQETDFIFSLIGEELGFVGTTLVVGLYLVILTCGLRIVWRTADLFGQLLGLGITFLIGFQAFINIGVATSSLPNKGIPLPFVSYGGSDLVALLSGLGLLLSLTRHAPVLPLVDLTKDKRRSETPPPPRWPPRPARHRVQSWWRGLCRRQPLPGGGAAPFGRSRRWQRPPQPPLPRNSGQSNVPPAPWDIRKPTGRTRNTPTSWPRGMKDSTPSTPKP